MEDCILHRFHNSPGRTVLNRMMRIIYALISPVRDEAESFGCTILSMT